MKLKSVFKKNKSSASIEFLAVFSFLFMFFILILDVALYFRQLYMVQTIADEALARLAASSECYSDTNDTADIIQETIENYFGTYDFSVVKTKSNILSIYTSDNDRDYKFLLTCRNSKTPDSLIFTYTYKGIFMYRSGKTITSNTSVNTTYY